MKKRQLMSGFIISGLLILFLSSCATTININVRRPGNLDLKGAKTIAVLPFEESEYNPYDYFFDNEEGSIENYFYFYNKIKSSEKQLLDYLHSTMEKEISNSPYITLVNYVPTETALKYNRDIPSDIFITGEVVSFKVHDNIKKIKKRDADITGDVKKSENNDVNKSVPETVSKPVKENDKNKENDDFYYEFQYFRDVQFIFKYEIIDGRNFEVISFDTVSFDENSDYVDDKKLLPTPFSLISGNINSFVSSFIKDIVPYTERKSITLLEDKTKNEEMKKADKLAKDGYLRDSYNIFLKIYNETNYFEAGYNAAMILMAMGQLNESESLMNDVYEKTGNIKALEALSDIKNEIKQAERLEKQLNSRKTI